MSRYKRKTDRKLIFTEEKLVDIRQKLEAGRSKRSIAKEMGINEATLRKRVKYGNVPKSLGRFTSDIPEDLEADLARQVKELDQMFYGVTKKNLQIAAYKFAEANNLQHRFNKDKQMAGESWVKGFCQRNRITLRQPEKCSMARIMGFNKIQVHRFYENLKKLYERRQYPPSSIYNMDETGLSTVPNKLPKVLASKGKKLVGKVASADRGQTITAVCCMSTTGTYIPPALIFPRKRMKDELFLNAPTGTLKMISESGYINTELFCQWLAHFKNFAKPSAERPILLILDNHSSHRDWLAIKYCRENHIDLLSLPPHSSQKMQPLDIGLFGPLKNAYSRECDKWMINNPGKVITQMQVAGLFNIAYSCVANIQKAENAFKASGIYPYDPDLFQDVDFAPSFVTDAPLDSTVNSSPNRENFATVEVVDTCHLNSGNDKPENNNTESRFLMISHVTPPLDVSNLDIECEDGVIIPNYSQAIDEDLNRSVAASKILPLPKIKEKSNRRKVRSQKSEILSGTPFKEELKELEKKKVEQGKRKEAVKKKLIRSCKMPGTSIKVQKKKKQKNDDDVSCPGCGGLYSQSNEDWIMCFQCKEWWHESCATYVTGIFVCFNCKV